MAWVFRKLQKISGSYLVSLPKSWIDALELNKNSIIGIKVQDNGTLVISPKTNQEEIKDELNLNFFKYISRDVVKNLLSGIEKINITSDKIIDLKIKKELKEFVKELPNIEIVEDMPQRIVIQNFGFKKIPTNKIIERLLYIVSDMFKNIKMDADEELKDNFTQLRKFYFLLVIHIRTFLRKEIYNLKIKDLTPLTAMDHRIFCGQIKQIGTILKNFKLNDKIREFFEKVELYYHKIMDAYLKMSNQLIYEVWFNQDVLLEEAKKLINTLNYEERDRIWGLWMIIRLCKHMAALI